jgi:hypothetical protein
MALGIDDVAIANIVLVVEFGFFVPLLAPPPQAIRFRHAKALRNTNVNLHGFIHGPV